MKLYQIIELYHNDILIYFSIILKTPCENSNFTGEFIESISSITSATSSLQYKCHYLKNLYYDTQRFADPLTTYSSIL